ncbi:MAG: type I phosphomannose isomerase catalytic subunit [Isosphaeraceae bacterium]
MQASTMQRANGAATIETHQTLGPLRFGPILKRLIWGGRRLETILNKSLGDGADFAESWEIADHRADVSRLADGPLTGLSLRDLIAGHGRDLLGSALGSRTQFPLLVKFLDAHQVLSVQVHPDDALGQILVNDNGKTEAWVIVHAEPGSVIYAGLRPGVDRARFEAALDSGAVEPLLHRFPAKAGDCILIPAGTVHAIGAGVVLAEVQQMSDATFRVFDWGRIGNDGQPRPLHRAEALASIDFNAGPVNPWVVEPETHPWGTLEPLARCAYFSLDRYRVQRPISLGSADRFTILVGLGGSALVGGVGNNQRLEYGQTLLLPAALGLCEVVPEGEATVLSCVVP